MYLLTLFGWFKEKSYALRTFQNYNVILGCCRLEPVGCWKCNFLGLAVVVVPHLSHTNFSWWLQVLLFSDNIGVSRQLSRKNTTRITSIMGLKVSALSNYTFGVSQKFSTHNIWVIYMILHSLHIHADINWFISTLNMYTTKKRTKHKKSTRYINICK